jgi:hypothetical protein
MGYSALGIILLLLIALTILSFSYDKAIVKYLKKNLNEHLLTEIIIYRIDFQCTDQVKGRSHFVRSCH